MPFLKDSIAQLKIVAPVLKVFYRPDPWDVSMAPSLERMQQDASVLACRFKDAFHKHVGANLGS